MKRSLRSLPLFVAGSLFALAVVDVHQGLELLTIEASSLSLLLTIAGFVAIFRRTEGGPRRRVSLLLLAGAAAAFGLHALGYSSILRRSAEDWERLQVAEGERLAAVVSTSFAALSRDAREAARTLARDGDVAVAAEGSDAQDYRTRAFEALARYPISRAHPRAIPGATLYDAWRRPLAWSGENIALHASLEEPYGVPDSDLFIVEQGVYTYLVAVEPLQSRLGYVSVEVPLVAKRRIQNTYLEDYDALSFWAGRTAETEFFFYDDPKTKLRARLDAEGDPFWSRGGSVDRLYIGLDTDEGSLLGVTSVSGEAPEAARADARQSYSGGAALCLVLASLFVLILLAHDSPAPASLLPALWAFRFVVFLTDTPTGLGLDLDNPEHYASSLFLGLARSPFDFLFTAAVLLGTVLVLARRFLPPSMVPGFRPAAALATSAIMLLLFVGTNEVVLDAWMNSSFALTNVDVTFAPPKLALQLGLVLLFLASSAAALLVASFAGGGIVKALAVDAATVALFYGLLSRYGLGEHVVLSILPLVLARLATVRIVALRARWSDSGVYYRFGRYSLIVLLSVLVFYPSVARFEVTTIRDFIETTVTPVILDHGRSRTYAVVEAARAIDRMEREGRLDMLDRDDVAYRIWIETGLVASSLSSSVQVRDGEGRLVSRFALSFPAQEEEGVLGPAPDEWALDEETIASDPKHPGILLARRAIDGPDGTPWEIRLRLAADWRNLPFVSTSNPYLFLFRTSGVDAQFRFPYRELSLFVLEADGSPVFPSTGATLDPPEEVLEGARREPQWWDYRREGQRHEAYVVSDGEHVFVLSYPKTGLVTLAAGLASWTVLAAALALTGLLVAFGLGALGSPRGVSPSEIWADIGASFSGKLYIAFVLIALVPIASLAFLIRGIVIGQLERDVEQDGMGRALTVERFVNDFLRYQRVDPVERGPAKVSDGVLEWVGSLADVDVDLYAEGELAATSKPELFGSGLLRARAVPSAYRDLVLEQRMYSIHREAVGSFEYLVVSVPIELETSTEPGILALPLASREAEIARRVSSLNRALLLAALCFSVAAAALAYSLARRIAGPINTLTEATHRVADGDLDVSLQTTSKDEIGALFASFIQMTADLKQQRSDLEKTKKLEAWAEMARQVAHEVKNPLTPIQLSAEHLLRVHKDPNVDFEKVLDECTETILQQVKTLRQISMEFSTFASPDALKPEPSSIEELVRETVEPYLQAPPDGVTLSLDVTPDLPQIQVDRRLLKRTLLNLVENALHAVNGSGEIDIDVQPGSVNGERFIQVDVSDTGVGIDHELKERIFEPYFSTRAAGTGLGLAIAKKVVEDHGGTISLESERDRGTRVTMRLPIRSDH